MNRLSSDGTIKEVRADHVFRYQWAIQRLSGHIVDAGCNAGYGAAMLADGGLSVTAIDCWQAGLDYAAENYDRPAIEWVRADLLKPKLPACDGVVAFEVIEHLADPKPLLKEARSVARTLLASVPNEDVFHWRPELAPVHHRHYTKEEFNALLLACGWTPVSWYGQGPHSDLMDGSKPHGGWRTLVVECE